MKNSTTPIPGKDYILPKLIIWSEILKQIEPFDIQLQEFLKHRNIPRYPDGSAYVGEDQDILLVTELLQPHRSKVLICDNTSFRPLKCFSSPPNTYYQLETTYQYLDNIGGEEFLLVAPVGGEIQKFDEDHPEYLLVKVRFWGGLKKAAQPRIFQAVMAWADSVGAQGMFGEGPALFFPDSILFSRRWANFRIDISRSGQHTVNWLTISILNYANQGDYVSEIHYGGFDETEEEYFKRVGRV